MNHRLTLIVSFPLFRLVSGNLGRWVWAHTLRVYKVFTKTGWGPWLRGDCLGPTGVINCTPLSALSFGVNLFPVTRGYNSEKGSKYLYSQESECVTSKWLESNHFQILARLIGSLSGKSIVRIKSGQLKCGRSLEQRSMFQSYELAVFYLLVGEKSWAKICRQT